MPASNEAKALPVITVRYTLQELVDDTVRYMRKKRMRKRDIDYDEVYAACWRTLAFRGGLDIRSAPLPLPDIKSALLHLAITNYQHEMIWKRLGGKPKS